MLFSLTIIIKIKQFICSGRVAFDFYIIVPQYRAHKSHFSLSNMCNSLLLGENIVAALDYTHSSPV